MRPGIRWSTPALVVAVSLLGSPAGADIPPGESSLAEADLRLVGEAGGDFAGDSVAGVGDLDGDGFDDLVVGADGVDTGAEEAGAAYVFYGPLAEPLDLAGADATLVSEVPFEGAGISASAAGDLDADGLDDFVVGAWALGAGTGAAYVVYGGARLSGTISFTDVGARLVGEAFNDRAGRDVSGAGDLDADGFDDLVVGANLEDAAGTNAGAAYVFYGSGERLAGEMSLGQADAKLTGEAAGDLAGFGLSGAGDLDRDGVDDLAVGASREGTGGDQAGAVYLIYGSGERLAGTISLGSANAKVTGAQDLDHAGFTAPSGDLDGDGILDLAVGAPGDFTCCPQTGAGTVYVLYGTGARLAGTISLGTADATFVGAEADFAGEGMGIPGDLDADGFDDLVIGAPGPLPIPEDVGRPGRAYVFFGDDERLAGPLGPEDADATLVGELDADFAGIWVDPAGDVNADGFADVAIGASDFFSVDRPGVAYVVFGPNLSQQLGGLLGALPDDAFRAPGHRTAFLGRLADVEEAVASGETDEALKQLQSMRKRVDGCGASPDRDDWVLDCDPQLEVRELLERLMAELAG